MRVFRVFRYWTLWSAVAILIGYWLLVKGTPIRPRGDGLRAVFLVLSGWGLFAYWPPFKRALLTEGWPTGPHLYAVMVFTICAGINLNCSMGLLWRLSGQPAFLINNAVFDFWVVLGIVALLIAVTVPNLFGRDVPPREKIQLGGVWMAMFMLTMWLTLARPNLDPLSDLVRPWLDSGYNYEPE